MRKTDFRADRGGGDALKLVLSRDEALTVAMQILGALRNFIGTDIETIVVYVPGEHETLG